jgi:tRNA 2-thiouridine synthesizing protein A
MTQDHSGTPTLIDARGLNCPLPVLRLRKRLQGLASGTTVELLTTDRAALRDVPAFCEAQGHAVMSTRSEEGAIRFVILAR